MGRRIAIGLALLIGAAAAWLLLRPGPEQQLAELIAELRARGEPVTLAEMARPLPPPAENAASDLEAAVLLPSLVEEELDWELGERGLTDRPLRHWIGREASPARMLQLEGCVGPLSDALDRIAAASRKAAVAWEPVPNPSAGAIAAERERFPTMCRAQCLLRPPGIAGSPDQRLRAIRTSLELAHKWHVRASDPWHAAQHFGEGCQYLRVGLEQGRIDPTDAQRAVSALLASDWQAQWRRMVRGERAALIEQLPAWLDGSVDAAFGADRPGVGDWLLHEIRYRRSADRVGLDTYPDDVLRARWHVVDALRGIDALLDPSLGAAELWRRCRAERDALAPTVEVLAMRRNELVRGDALGRLAATALGAYAHRREHGDWPASAQELAPVLRPDAWLDPYTGAPFGLALDGADLVLTADPWEGVTRDDEERVELGLRWRLPPR